MKHLITFLLCAVTLNVSAQTEQQLANKDSVAEIIALYDIKHPDIVLRQAMFESGWLQCDNCSWDVGNPFGFFWKGKYLEFCDLHDAVSYYKWWQDQLYQGGDYYAFLDRVGYATYPNYIQELKRMW